MDSKLTISGDLGGAPLNSTISRSADGSIRQTISLPAAVSGTLSTRTSDTAGVLTVAGHALQMGDIIDIYWDGGRRYDVDVDSVAGDDVTFSGGTGDVLPAQDTDITTAEQTVIDVDFDGANLVGIGAVCPARAHLGFFEGAANELSVDLVAKETWFWVDGGTAANPLAATVVGSVKASQSSTAAIKLDLGVLYDSTP